MPLILAPVGQEMKIVKIAADEKTKKHLANLGVIVQSGITVLSYSEIDNSTQIQAVGNITV